METANLTPTGQTETEVTELAVELQPNEEQEAQRRAFYQAKADLEQEIAEKVQIFAAQYATETTVNCHVDVKVKANTDGTISVTPQSVYVTTTIGQKAI